jgi:hypothetical protein
MSIKPSPTKLRQARSKISPTARPETRSINASKAPATQNLEENEKQLEPSSQDSLCPPFSPNQTDSTTIIPSSYNFDFNTHPKIPDWVSEIHEQLRSHEERFQQLESLLAENVRLKDELHTAHERIEQLEKRLEHNSPSQPTPMPADMASSESSPTFDSLKGTMASRYAYLLLYSQHRRTSTILGSLCSLIFDYA